jgi:GT2 family glycosyltransferase
MLPYMGREEVVAIANQKLGPDGFPDRRHIRMLPRRSGDMVTEYSALDFSSFVGLLVSHKAIHTIGLPKAELFYQEDDSEYCLRLRSVGVIAFAEKSCVTHKYASAAGIAKTFRGRTYNRMSADRYCLRYFYWRNRLWLRRISSSITSRTFLECLREFCHEVALVVLVDRDHTLLRLSILVRAFRNGMTARFDNVFPFTVQTRLLKRIQRIGVNYPLYRWIQLTFRR